jgi:hypothetical protein
MATLEGSDPNILDAEAVNWRLVVYPLVGIFVLIVGALGIYFYLQNQRTERESAARAAFLQAQTPAALVQVADQFPGTTHAVLALLGAGDLSFGQKDFDGAQKDYRRITEISGVDASLRDSAQLGLAASLEASGRSGPEAISAYLDVAHRGKKSPYAPFAYLAAARLYEQEHDRDGERRLLTEAIGLGGDSPFVKEAQQGLENLDTAGANASLPEPTLSSPTP